MRIKGITVATRLPPIAAPFKWKCAKTSCEKAVREREVREGGGLRSQVAQTLADDTLSTSK